jgi:hypothetical protein
MKLISWRLEFRRRTAKLVNECNWDFATTEIDPEAGPSWGEAIVQVHPSRIVRVRR